MGVIWQLRNLELWLRVCVDRDADTGFAAPQKGCRARMNQGCLRLVLQLTAILDGNVACCNGASHNNCKAPVFECQRVVRLKPSRFKTVMTQVAHYG